jgi:hypothetical protein
MEPVRLGTSLAAVAAAFLGWVGAAQAQGAVEWVEPGRQRIVVADNTAPERRQVRFVGRGEAADYVRFRWRELAGELVYLYATHRRASLGLPLSVADVPRQFNLGHAGELELGTSARGSYLLGTAYGQRFTVSGSDKSCFSFLSTDRSGSGDRHGRPVAVIYGYACSPTEEARPEIRRFLSAVRLLDDDLDGLDAALVAAGDDVSDAASAFALGSTSGAASSAVGLVQSPVGNARRDSAGGH